MTKETHRFQIRPDGTIEGLYQEVLTLDTCGDRTIRRASSVEPSDDGSWQVQIGLIGGESLCMSGFRTRSDALAAEKAWIVDNFDRIPRTG